MNIVLTSLLVFWSLGGLVFYWSIFDKAVRKTPQKIVMYLLAGPLVFCLLPLFFLIDIIAEKLFAPLYRWLQK